MREARVHTVAALALVQFGLSLVAIAAGQVGRTTIIVAAMGSLVLGALIIAVLESPEWVPMPERVAAIRLELRGEDGPVPMSPVAT